MKIPNCLRRDIFLAKLITLSKRKASLSSQVCVTLLAWFTAKSINFSINSTTRFSINYKFHNTFFYKYKQYCLIYTKINWL